MKPRLIISGSKDSCADYCISDSGTTCNNCRRFENTNYMRMMKKEFGMSSLYEQLKKEYKDSLTAKTRQVEISIGKAMTHSLIAIEKEPPNLRLMKNIHLELVEVKQHYVEREKLVTFWIHYKKQEIEFVYNVEYMLDRIHLPSYFPIKHMHAVKDPMTGRRYSIILIDAKRALFGESSSFLIREKDFSYREIFYMDKEDVTEQWRKRLDTYYNNNRVW